MAHLILDDPGVTVAIADKESVAIIGHGHAGGLAVVGVVRPRLESRAQGNERLLVGASVGAKLEYLGEVEVFL